MQGAPPGAPFLWLPGRRCRRAGSREERRARLRASRTISWPPQDPAPQVPSSRRRSVRRRAIGRHASRDDVRELRMDVRFGHHSEADRVAKIAAGDRRIARIDDHAAFPQQIGRELVLGRAVRTDACNERSRLDIGKRKHRVCRCSHGDDDVRAACGSSGACDPLARRPSAVPFVRRRPQPRHADRSSGSTDRRYVEQRIEVIEGLQAAPHHPQIARPLRARCRAARADVAAVLRAVISIESISASTQPRAASSTATNPWMVGSPGVRALPGKLPFILRRHGAGRSDLIALLT